jgi:O-antigen ligase
MKFMDYHKAYLILACLFAFSLPLSRALVSIFTILLILLYLLEGNFKYKLSLIKSQKPLLVLALIFFLHIIYFLPSQDIKLGFSILRLDLYMLVIYILGTTLKKEDINKVISAFLSGMFVSEIISYGVYFGLWKFGHATHNNPSPFMHHIEYSIFLAFTSIILLNKLVSNRYTLKEKIVYFIFFITVTGNLFIGIGRTGQVAYIAAIFVMMFTHYRVTIKSFMTAFVTISILFSIAFFASSNFRNRLHSASTDIEHILQGNLNGSWGIRIAYWKTTYDILKKHPFGNGIGDYKLVIKKQFENNPKRYQFISDASKDFMSRHHPHNEYLLVLLQTGIPGLILFIYFIYTLFKLPIQDKEIKEISILFLTIYTVGFFAEPLILRQFSLALFSLFTGLFIAASKTDVASSISPKTTACTLPSLNRHS